MFLFYVCTKLFQKRGHYSRGDIIQGRTLFKGNTVDILDKWVCAGISQVFDLWPQILYFFNGLRIRNRTIYLRIEKTIIFNLCIFWIYTSLICIFESIDYYFAFTKFEPYWILCILWFVLYYFEFCNFRNNNFVNFIRNQGTILF